MRFHAMQTNPVWMDVSANRAEIERRMHQLSPSRGDFVVLPEMCETAWTSDSALCSAAHSSTGWNSLEWFSSLAVRSECWLQAGLVIRESSGRLANAVAVFSPTGECKSIYRKNFLFPSERAQYAAGDRVTLLNVDGVTVCPLICYDLRFPELWRLAALAGAEVFAVSSSWPSVRHEHWRQLLVARAIENQACVIASNRTGNDPTLVYSGASVAIDQLGQRAMECDASESCASLTFDRPSFDAWRERFSALRDVRASFLGTIEVDRR
jgi:omega-amidase